MSLHLFCTCAIRLASAVVVFIANLIVNGKLSSSRGLLLHDSVDFLPKFCLGQRDCAVCGVVRWPVGSVWAVVPN